MARQIAKGLIMVGFVVFALLIIYVRDCNACTEDDCNKDLSTTTNDNCYCDEGSGFVCNGKKWRVYTWSCSGTCADDEESCQDVGGGDNTSRVDWNCDEEPTCCDIEHPACDEQIDCVYQEGTVSRGDTTNCECQ